MRASQPGQQCSARDFPIDLAYEVDNESANIFKELSATADESSQNLWKDKDKLTMGQIKQHLVLTVVIVLASFIAPLLKEWRSASVQRKFPASVHAPMVNVVLLWFAVFFKFN